MIKLSLLDQFRTGRTEFGGPGEDKGGTFWIRHQGTVLHVVASVGRGWDHVSVSCADRVPSWYEMEHVRRLFFKPDEVCMQLHVTAEDHINCHPNTLHLWRPHLKKIPLPPKELV